MLLKLFSTTLLVAGVAASSNLTIVENAMAEPTLSTLVTVLSSPGYEAALALLSSPGNYTVFAPNDAAFAAAGLDITDVPLVGAILSYHLLGSTLEFNSGDMTPLQFQPSLMMNQSFVNLGAGIGQVMGITSTADSVTISFGRPGVATSTATVVVANVHCSNGVVHIIDRVLSFPQKVSEAASAAGLTELVAALIKADLVAAVDDAPGVTILAPSNEAMSAVNWEDLDVATLKTVLMYHVVTAVAYSTDVTDGLEVKTLQGQNVTFTVGTTGVTVGATGAQASDLAAVTSTDVITKNGVVHVINKVLMPVITLSPTAAPTAPTPSSATGTCTAFAILFSLAAAVTLI